MIHEATAADAPVLAGLHLGTVTVAYRDIFPPDSSPPSIAELTLQYERLLGRGDRVWFWSDDGWMHGAIALVRDPAVPAGRRIERFNVHPNHQGQGIGRRLYDHAIAESSGPLNLWVLEANKRARRIYERWGWTLVPGRTLPNDPPEILDVLYELDRAELAETSSR